MYRISNVSSQLLTAKGQQNTISHLFYVEKVIPFHCVPEVMCANLCRDIWFQVHYFRISGDHLSVRSPTGNFAISGDHVLVLSQSP